MRRRILRFIRRLKQEDCYRHSVGVWLRATDGKCHNTCMFLCEDCRHRWEDEMQNIIEAEGDME